MKIDILPVHIHVDINTLLMINCITVLQEVTIVGKLDEGDVFLQVHVNRSLSQKSYLKETTSVACAAFNGRRCSQPSRSPISPCPPGPPGD